jgi:rhodanese-related sulfurtransferase
MVSRRNVLALGAVFGVAAVAGYSQVYPSFDGRAIDAAEAHAMAQAGQITLIDIRRPDEWAATGTGDGAQPLDMRRDDFVAALSTLVKGDRNAPIALICARGVRSARLANQLTEAGFTQIINVPEGMLGSTAGDGWIASGLPVTPQ